MFDSSARQTRRRPAFYLVIVRQVYIHPAASPASVHVPLILLAALVRLERNTAATAATV